jgi:hypothetical protein
MNSTNFSQAVPPKVAEPIVNSIGDRITQRLEAETNEITVPRQRMICETVVAEFNAEQRQYNAEVFVDPPQGCTCGRCGIGLRLSFRTYH